MNRSITLSVLLVCLILGMLTSTAHARIYIRIDSPSEQNFPIAVKPLQGDASDLAKSMNDLLVRNLQIASYFDLIPPSSFLNDPTPDAFAEGAIDFSMWNAVGAQALIKGRVVGGGKGATVQWYLFDTQTGKQLIGKEYSFRSDDAYKVVHQFANEVMLALTGTPGIFDTEIVAACGGRGSKQLMTFHPDGTGKKTWTRGGNVISPDWSSDGSKIAYMNFATVRRNYQRPEIFLLDRGKGKSRSIFSRGSLNITPAISPSGAGVALTSNLAGDPEIYMVDFNGALKGRLTNSWKIDVSPAWSPDGSQLVFASERAGKLHLFKMDSGGGNPTRLTFVGYQNDQPAWSPTGDRIAFTSRDQGNFDIFIMNPDGSNIQRLTHGEGDNESPSWAADGRYVTFSSTRAGGSKVYVMRWDGYNPQVVTNESCVNPDWGPSQEIAKQN